MSDQPTGGDATAAPSRDDPAKALIGQAGEWQALLARATALGVLLQRAVTLADRAASRAGLAEFDDRERELWVLLRQVAGARGEIMEAADAQAHGARLAGSEAQLESDAMFQVWSKAISHLSRAAIQVLIGGDDPTVTALVPVSIYLSDESIHEQVEIAVEDWLATADVSIDARREPVIGSWFRLMSASLKRVVMAPVGREVLLTAAHVADSHLVQAQDAYVTATLLQNVGPVLQALQPTKDAVVRTGALLIVKVDWVVHVHQLTAAQQVVLDHQPDLAASPGEIIAALQSPDSAPQETTLQSAAPQLGTGTTATTATN